MEISIQGYDELAEKMFNAYMSAASGDAITNMTAALRVVLDEIDRPAPEDLQIIHDHAKNLLQENVTSMVLHPGTVLHLIERIAKAEQQAKDSEEYGNEMERRWDEAEKKEAEVAVAVANMLAKIKSLEQQLQAQQKEIELGRDERMDLRDRNSSLEKQVELLRAALIHIRSGMRLMIPEPQQSAFIEIVNTALASRAALSPQTDKEKELSDYNRGFELLKDAETELTSLRADNKALLEALKGAKGFIENALAGGLFNTIDIQRVLSGARIAIEHSELPEKDPNAKA